MLIDLVAFWLFLYGFQIIAFLHDYDFLFLPQNHMLRLNLPARQDADDTIIKQAGNFGLLIAYVISWVIANKKNWHWINGVIVFVVSFALGNLGYFGWRFVRNIFMAPGKILPEFNKWGYMIDSVIMLAIGLVLLLSKKIIRYIDHDHTKPGIVGNSKASGKKQAVKTK